MLEPALCKEQAMYLLLIVTLLGMEYFKLKSVQKSVALRATKTRTVTVDPRLASLDKDMWKIWTLIYVRLRDANMEVVLQHFSEGLFQ